MNEEAQNPFRAPVYAEPVKTPIDAVLQIPNCPRCGSSAVSPTPYSVWQGRRSPDAMEDLTCGKCKCNFNGTTRIEYPPRKSQMPWFILSGVAFLIYVFGYIGFILLMFLAQ